MNESGLIQSLKAKIEARHVEAVRALQVLEVYLRECQVPTPESLKIPAKKHGKRRGHGTFRDRVTVVLSDTWSTVDEIARAAGLEVQAVRGVLYAANREELGIEARRTERGAEFRRRATN